MPELQVAFSDGVKMKATIFMFIILLSACVEQPELIISKPYLDEIFTKKVNSITAKHQIEKLRETNLSGDDFEIRVWVTGGKPDAFILKRAGNEWSAVALKEFDCKTVNYYPKDKPYELGKIKFSSPKSGWENLWEKLSAAGILDLPGSEKTFIDGMSYFVETNRNGIYRVYFYNNPNLQKSEDAAQMLKIGEIIADEFGLYNFKYGSLCLEN